MVTTVTTVTTITTVTILGVSAVISIAAVATLLIFLATREIAAANNSPFSLRITRFASVGILPLIMAFVVVVIIKIAETL